MNSLHFAVPNTQSQASQQRHAAASEQFLPHNKNRGETMYLTQRLQRQAQGARRATSTKAPYPPSTVAVTSAMPPCWSRSCLDHRTGCIA
ncbi:hypothetical protein D3880_10245 [Pseudomonas cavernae]|uniref:Uncharacterized protein n=1 Tax=Pseudomonas cavernae TaxID=2320867 RepID=A0A385Z2M0_9PSED|nr:hypothetical protein D3880_10245 [Pseudomonas cavernae]